MKAGFFPFCLGLVFVHYFFSLSEFCSQEHWALADGAVGVEEAWYFLGKEVKLHLPNLGVHQAVRVWSCQGKQ